MSHPLGHPILRFKTAACAFVALSSLALSAGAQDREPSASDIGVARNLGLEGVKLADAGNCPAAIDKLSRAEGIYHAPTILERLGECQIATGKLVAGTESLQRVVREPLKANAPPAFVAAQARAKKVLDTAQPKIARLKIHVDNGVISGLVVKVDGEPIQLATLDVDRPTDPGAHQVEVSCPGYKTTNSVVSLPESGSAAVTLKLDPDGSAVAAAAPAPYAQPVAGAPPGYAPAAGAPPGAAPGTYPNAAAPGAAGAPLAPTADAGTGGGSHTAAFVLLGVGGAGLVVGTITGIMAMGKKSDLDGACGTNKAGCPASAQSNIDSMNTLATVSTVGFVVGVLGAGAGGILLLTGSHAQAGAPAHAGDEENRRRVAITPYIGFGSAGVAGAF